MVPLRVKELFPSVTLFTTQAPEISFLPASCKYFGTRQGLRVCQWGHTHTCWTAKLQHPPHAREMFSKQHEGQLQLPKNTPPRDLAQDEPQ